MPCADPAKIGLSGEEHPEHEVLGMAVYLRAADIPERPHWVHAQGSPICCISLDSFLREWLAREPDNPYVAVFAPLIIETDAELTQRAPLLWQTIQQAPLDADTRETLSNRQAPRPRRPNATMTVLHPSLTDPT